MTCPHCSSARIRARKRRTCNERSAGSFNHLQYLTDTVAIRWRYHHLTVDTGTVDTGRMDYLTSITEAIRFRLPAEAQSGDFGLFLLYALLARSKGLQTTAEDVHDAWATWKVISGADHDALVPFSALSQEVQEKDLPFLRAIHEVARGAETGPTSIS